MAQEQNYNNHARYDPPYHFVLFGILLIWFGGAVCLAYRDFNTWTALPVLGGIGLFIAFFKIRLYPLKVQDRVIRLEERLRLATLLPERLRGRIGEFSESQLIALRFASDGELAELAEQVLQSNMKPADIKKAIKNWRADNWRV